MDELLNLEVCTLPTAQRPVRLAEFDALFEFVTAVEHHDNTTRLHLTGAADLARRVRDLTDRESTCCSFFTFTIDGSNREVDLEITVPPEHRRIVAAIAENATRTPRRDRHPGEAAPTTLPPLA